jgi:PAS domain S-box-containing protein
MADDAFLRADYERLRLTFQAMGSGLWDYDIANDRLFCNARWYEILGLDPDITPITTITEFRHHIHDEDVDSATTVDYDRVSQLIASDGRYHHEFRIVRPDGEIRWVRSVACVILDSATHQPRAVGCITDITEFQAGKANNELPMEQPATLQPAPETPAISDRERECLRWVSVGKTAWETAVILGLSRRTIEFHLNNAVRKLGASNKVHATTTAIRLGLL